MRFISTLLQANGRRRRTVRQSTELVAGIAEENSSASEEISASAQEMNAQVEEMVSSAQTLKELAVLLEQSVAAFKIE